MWRSSTIVKKKKEEFYLKKAQLSLESKKSDWDYLSTLNDEIKTLSKFPRYLREFVVADFTMFIFTALFEAIWLDGNQNTDIVSDTIIPIVFIFAILLFLIVGFYAVTDVAGWMVKQFEKAKADKEEVEKALNDAKADLSANITISKEKDKS